MRSSRRRGVPDIALQRARRLQACCRPTPTTSSGDAARLRPQHPAAVEAGSTSSPRSRSRSRARHQDLPVAGRRRAQKKLWSAAVCSGPNRRATSRPCRIHDGRSATSSRPVLWNQGALWNRGRKPEWSDTEWQLRNWYYFAWLCGDTSRAARAQHRRRQLGDEATGAGGRHWRPAGAHRPSGVTSTTTSPSTSITENGVHMFACAPAAGHRGQRPRGPGRQQGHLPGHEYKITGANAFDQGALKRKEVSPYVQEHTDFIASIRKGEPISELKFTTESTATAIMGREAATPERWSPSTTSSTADVRRPRRSICRPRCRPPRSRCPAGPRTEAVMSTKHRAAPCPGQR